MSTCRHQSLIVASLLVFVLILLLPFYLYAQEEVPQTASTTNATSSASVTTEASMPYALEPLLGDAIFGDFVVGPGKIELAINPGESKTVDITIANRTGSSRIFEIHAEDIAGSSDPSRALILLGDDRGPYSMKDYVQVASKRFELPHNQRARIPVTISIPPDAEPGGLYGSVLVSTVSTEARKAQEDGTAPQSAVVARIGTSFFITIPGTVAKDGNLTDFTTVPEKHVYQNGPIPFGLLFENRGSTHLAPYGEIRINNIFNEEVGFIELEPWFVLPDALRLREVSWERDVLFGRYTATAYINRSYDDVIDELTYTFWVLPWKPLLLGFLGLFFILFMIRTFFRKFEFKRKV